MERYLGDVGDIIGKIVIWRAKYSTSPKGEEETALWLWASSVEIVWRGSMLNVGLVLPRSRGFGGKQPSERSWATSFVMVLGRRTCLGRASSTAGGNLPRGEALSSSSNVAMSKRVSFKKIGEKLEKTAGASSGTPIPAKGVVIGEKWAGESIISSPSKKGKADDGSKGKGVDSGSEGKKKATSSIKASAAPTAVPSPPGKGPQLISEKVEKLTLDQTETKFFHVIGQALVLGSPLAVRSKEAGEQASLQEGRVASMETEVSHLQKFTADLEQQLAKSRAREQQANHELAKMKSDRDLLTDKLERSGLLVNELRKALDRAKESAVEEFKSSSEFMVAIEDSASKYFGEGFDFCKVQLRRHHPDLAIYLESTVVDQDLLAEQDEATEEREKENLGENKGGN
ncbi:hypothetical protein Acr_00g0075600 [Actinidia rufa]|uniref:Uncharacterized protein n=1 Tax=Actinidia rufa TaxID=165716 RepID=A0A7J0DSR5_9ERIC|nr:hypothetical protein Acr_00g0075600 [Actinidia rufa]